jgi:hypothetical protein
VAFRKTYRPGSSRHGGETFEKCTILFKAKEGDNFNHPREIGFAFHGAGTNTLSILRINPPKFGGGLKFETDAGIGQKGAFCKDLAGEC